MIAVTFRAWQTLIVALLFAALAAGASMVYANKVARDSQRQWCGVVTTLDDAYRVTPPRTPAGQKIAQDIRRLRTDFDCPADR